MNECPGIGKIRKAKMRAESAQGLETAASTTEVSREALTAMPVEPRIQARIHVRQPDAQDTEPVGKFLVGLSLISRNHRFFSGIRNIRPDLVEAMVTMTPSQLILLAVDGDAVVGHVMAAYEDDEAVDIGIVVAEEYQHQGIGRRLVKELVAALAPCDMIRVKCDVLGENQLVLDWLYRLLPDIRLEREGETMIVHGTLAPQAI